MLPRILVILSLTTVLSSCEDMEKAVKNWNNIISEPSAYTTPEGSDASEFFDPALKDITINVTNILGALDAGIQQKATANLYAQGILNLADTEEPVEVTSGTASVLKENQKAKKDLEPSSYLKDNDSDLNPENAVSSLNFAVNDTVTWDASVADEYTIPVLDKMPVRDQGQRGTCASFSAIGQIEGYILQNTSLSSIDLSEQRFYAMSKPDNWADGGNINSGGSNSGNGFKSSYYTTTQYGNQTSPSTYNIIDGYNIPLESQCPYVKKLVDNDIQYPTTKDTDGCKSGVAQVTDFAAWMYQWDLKINTAQEIYNFIRDKKYPVIVASYLSSNWENNDGIITYADAKAEGDTIHSSGHAYLVVGMKKLNETEYPGEGGMCFIIKNSWGKGWGINGLSCMTLAWFNNFRKDGSYGFPWLISASIDEAALGTEKTKTQTKPDTTTIDEPDPGTEKIINKNTRRKGRISFAISNNNSIKLTADDFELGFLRNNNDEIKKILYRTEGSTFTIRGLLDNGTKQTNDLELAINGEALEAEFDGNNEKIQVGKWDSTEKILTLCSGEFHNICYFNYLSENNQLLLSLTEEQTLTDKTEGPYSWTYIGAGGQGFEISFPTGFSTKVDLRFRKDNITTNPLRFRIAVTSGKILYQGVEVGDIKVGICNGDYKKVCDIFRTDTEFLVRIKS